MRNVQINTLYQSTLPQLLTIALLTSLASAGLAAAQELTDNAPILQSMAGYDIEDLASDHTPHWAYEAQMIRCTSSASTFPEEERNTLAEISQQHHERMIELGRLLYARQVEFDALTSGDVPKKRLDALDIEMLQIRRTMYEEDAQFTSAMRNRLGPERMQNCTQAAASE